MAERMIASLKAAFERLHVGMNFLVRIEGVLQNERLPTLVALKWPIAGVSALMQLQSSLRRIAPAAILEGALKRLLSFMNPLVDRENTSSGEGLQADVARDGMNPLMNLELIGAGEALRTFLAFEELLAFACALGSLNIRVLTGCFRMVRFGKSRGMVPGFDG